MLLSVAEKIVDSYFAIMPRPKPDSDAVDKALLIAHRGAHDNAKGTLENTLAAFKLAKEIGCWGIEFDVRATSDGVLVVNHDATLSRLWGYDVAIANLSFEALRTLEPGVPSLAEVIAVCGSSMHLFIELKMPFQNIDALIQDLDNLIPCKDYHLLSLDAPIFNTLSQFPKESFLLVAELNNVKKFCELSIHEGYGGVLGSYLLLSDKYIKKIKEANQIAGVGFVNSKYSLYRELNRGLGYIFTNCAAALNSHLRNLQQF